MGTLTQPYVFTPGTYAVAAQVDANFQVIFDWINGGGAIWNDAAYAFTNIPTGPNVDPTSANQFTRKSYVDGKIPGILQGSSTVISTNSSGQAAIPFPTAFPNSIVTVTASIGDVGRSNTLMEMVESDLTTSEFVVQFYNSETGAALGSGLGFRVNWIALGT